jgi:DNA polymerase-3 subunit epsilon
LTAAQREHVAAAHRRPLKITPPRPAAPSLLELLTAMSLVEVLEEGAPVGSTAYLEMLFDALEDGDISDNESEALQELCAEYDLAPADVAAAHDAFLLALAHRALDDGRISHEERRELRSLASLLGVAEAKVKRVLEHADAARMARLSAGLGALPEPWLHGEPLRVGDRVAFTGCDEVQRLGLEHRAEQLGVRVISSVSKRTVMLVTDGSFSGGKLARAQELGTRQVHPDLFDTLLQHLQPAAVSGQRIAGAPTSQTASGVGADTAPSPSAIRAWAVSAGFEVGVRGRLPKSVLDAFANARG